MKKIFLPNKIDIEKIIIASNNQFLNSITGKLEKYDFDIKKLRIESIYYILYLIFYSTIHRLNVKNQEEKNKYVNTNQFIFNDVYIDLPSTLLQSIDRDYHKIMKFLTNQHLNYDNLLFRNEYKNGKSYSYSMNYTYINSGYKIIDLTRLSIINNIKKNCTISIKGKIIDKKLKKLKNDFLFKFDVDFSKLSNKLMSQNIISEYSSLISLFDYHNGRRWMSLNDKTDGRLHTNFTNLSSQYRKLITNKSGENLVELDIGSCIPYLFIISLMYNTKLKNLIIENDNLVLYQEIFEDNINYYTKNEIIEPLITELKHIYVDILDNNFYKRFTTGSDLQKSDILSLFFCEIGTKPKVEQKLKELYPHIHYILNQLKNNQTWIKKYGYPPYENCNKVLAHYLFHIEASIMLFKLIDNIKKYNKNIEIITIHDCVMISEKYLDEVKLIMENTFKEHIGFPPKLKVKILD